MGPATVQMVVERLPKERPLAYTTVQSVLNTLHRKGKVKRKLDAGLGERVPDGGGADAVSVAE